MKKITSQQNKELEDKLARLTGFNQSESFKQNDDEDDKDDEDLSDQTNSRNSSLLSDEELEEQITRHSFANSPLSKLVFVAGGMFVIVFIAGLFFSQFQSPGDGISAVKASQTKEKTKSPLLSDSNQDKEKGELLSELALKEQKERLQAIENQKRQSLRLSVQPTKTPLVKTQPSTLPVAAKPTPLPQVRATQPPPKNPTYSVRNQTQYNNSNYPLSQRFKNSNLVAQTNQTDFSDHRSVSTQIWKDLSKVGSFGGNSQEKRTNYSVPSSLNSQPERPQTIINSGGFSRSFNNTEITNPASTTPDTISFGQSAAGVLKNTITWENSFANRNGQSLDERYLIVLNQPLKDNTGKVQIPDGSSLIVRLDSSSRALVNLIPESVVINGVTKPIPQGVLKIRASDGQPLIAQTRTIGGYQGNDNSLADAASVIGDVANIPGVRSLGTLTRLFNGNRNQYSTATSFFSVPEGSAVEVFVNKAFSLTTQSEPEQPLELK